MTIRNSAPFQLILPLFKSAGDVHYTYDANGNRVNANWPGPQGPNTQGMDYTYDRADRLVVGQAYQTNVGAGLVSALNRIDREVTRLFYDGLGRRLAKEYDPTPSPALPRSGGGSGGGGVKRTEYVYDGLDPVVEYSLWNGLLRPGEVGLWSQWIIIGDMAKGGIPNPIDLTQEHARAGNTQGCRTMHSKSF